MERLCRSAARARWTRPAFQMCIRDRNVGVPFENAPFGFWMVLGISVVASVAAFVLLWRKKMF